MILWVLNPMYLVRRVKWWHIRWWMGYRYKVVFRYATEEETHLMRYAKVHYYLRGYYRTEALAEARRRELYASPEWRRP